MLQTHTLLVTLGSLASEIFMDGTFSTHYCGGAHLNVDAVDAASGFAL